MLQLLRTELDAGHPVTGAYDADHEIAATQINAKNLTRPKPTVTGSEILNATDDAEFSGLTVARQSSWLALCAIEHINTSSGIAKALEAVFFAAGGVSTRANLIALRTESISRATELEFGNVSPGQIQLARSL